MQLRLMTNNEVPRLRDVRKLLRTSFTRIEQFDAFCLDEYPEVHNQFSVNMARIIKENLLLEYVAVDPQKLVAKIAKYREEVVENSGSETVQIKQQGGIKPSSDNGNLRWKARIEWMLIGAGLFKIIPSIFGFFRRSGTVLNLKMAILVTVAGISIFIFPSHQSPNAPENIDPSQPNAPIVTQASHLQTNSTQEKSESESLIEPKLEKLSPPHQRRTAPFRIEQNRVDVAHVISTPETHFQFDLGSANNAGEDMAEARSALVDNASKDMAEVKTSRNAKYCIRSIRFLLTSISIIDRNIVKAHIQDVIKRDFTEKDGQYLDSECPRLSDVADITLSSVAKAQGMDDYIDLETGKRRSNGKEKDLECKLSADLYCGSKDGTLSPNGHAYEGNAGLVHIDAQTPRASLANIWKIACERSIRTAMTQIANIQCKK